MTVNLILQYYCTLDSSRQAEINDCLCHNLHNELITFIHLLTEENIDFTSFRNQQKIIQMVIGERLTFHRAFQYANDYDPGGESIWILANADIWFDGTLSALTDAVLNKVVFALTRHEVQKDGSLAMVVPEFAHGSQDAWIFKTPIPVDRMYASFFLGIPGCDNRIAYELISAGYKLINPSLAIVIRHLDLARNLDIHERNEIYAEITKKEIDSQGKSVPSPYQCHLYPVDQTDPDKFEVYLVYLHHLSQQYDRICQQASQISQQGQLIAELYREVESISTECKKLKNSLSWKVTKPLRKLISVFQRSYEF